MNVSKRSERVRQTINQHSKLSEFIVISSIYIIIVCISTFPLIFNISRVVIGGGDTVEKAWNLWWVQWAFHNGNYFPYYTKMLYHPDGVTLSYHTLGLLNGWFTIILQSVFGINLVSTYNIISISSLIITGLGTYYLVKELTNHKLASFVASLIFTFSPIRMSRLLFGGLEMHSTQFIPFAVLFSIKMLKTHQFRYAVLTGIAIAATFWLSIILAYETILFISLLILLDIFFIRKSWDFKKFQRKITQAIILTFVVILLTSPLVIQMVNYYGEFQDQADQIDSSIANNADLLGFFIPDHTTNPLINRLFPFFGQLSEKVYGKFYGNPSEKTVFVGYSVLTLFVISLISLGKDLDWKWLLAGGIFLVLSFGPVFFVGGNPVLYHLPYEWLNRLPLIGFNRTPSRFGMFLMLSLAAIIGYGLAKIESINNKYIFFILIGGILIFFEFLVIPVPLDERFANIPNYYFQLAAMENNENHAVLDVPIDLFGAQGPAGNYMLYQTVHQKGILPHAF